MKKILKPIAGVAGSVTAFVVTASKVAAQEIEKPAAFFENIQALISKALTLVLAIGALMVFLYLIWGGIDWITSGGDKGKTEAARNKITAAVIGLIILAAAWAILTIALNFLGITDLNKALEGAGI